MEWVCERNAEERVLEYVDTHFLTLESLEQVADVLGYNYTYLSRMFKKITNMSASKYITNKKIALAKELLERADYITQLRNERHPYEKGIDARAGIEL